MTTRTGKDHRRPPLMNDRVFKAVFASPSSTHLLAGMLNAMLADELDPPITRLSLLPQERSSSKGKTVRMDIAAVDQVGRLFDIEAQRYSDAWYADRLMLYVSFLVTEQAEDGRPAQLRKVVALSIGERPLPGMEGCTEPIVKVRMQPDVGGARLNAQLPMIVHVNLKEVRRLAREGKAGSFDGRLNWCYYVAMEGDMLTQEDERMRAEYYRLLHGSPDFREAHARYMAATTKDRFGAFSEMMAVWKEEGPIITARLEGRTEGKEAGLQEGLSLGKEEGLSQGKLETARAMKERGSDVSFIIECTGLTEQQIAEL